MTRAYCPGCELSLPSCLCALVRPVASRIGVTVLQHPDEAAHAKGTVRLLQRCLGAGCSVQIGRQWPAPPALQDCWLLYPGDGPPPPGRPSHLLLIDGSWRQSRQLLQLNPWLQQLPRYALRDPPPTRYAALRRAHREGQLSSLEAVAGALAALDGNADGRDRLLQAMDDWLRLQRSLNPRANAPGTAPCP